MKIAGVVGTAVEGKDRTTMEILGIDVGGTGIKGAPVDVSRGTLIDDRRRFLTPQPATPEAVAETIAGLVEHFSWDGPVGCGFPAVVRRGIVMTAANIDDVWIGCDVGALLKDRLGRDVTMVNDADAAGRAEITFGAGRDVRGTVLVLTLGTGIGSALFVDGNLVPNTEFGHIEIDGKEAEAWASAAVREREELGWKRWAVRLNEYLLRMEAYLWPDLFILGGGVSKKHEKFLDKLTVRTPVVPAKLRNEAGIVGAALSARS